MIPSSKVVRKGENRQLRAIICFEVLIEVDL